MPSYPYPKLELKYCERCGGLWLRAQHSEAVYCARCAEAIAELPPVRGGTPSGTIQGAYACVLAVLAVLFNMIEWMGGALA